MERLRRVEDRAAIREGLAPAEAGDIRPARAVLAELQVRHALQGRRVCVEERPVDLAFQDVVAAIVARRAVSPMCPRNA